MELFWTESLGGKCTKCGMKQIPFTEFRFASNYVIQLEGTCPKCDSVCIINITPWEVKEILESGVNAPKEPKEFFIIDTIGPEINPQNPF